MRSLGLLRMRQGSGVYVSGIDSEDMLIPLHLFVSLEPGSVEALFEARIALESQVAALAASNITDEQLQQLRETVIEPPKTARRALLALSRLTSLSID